MLQEFQGDDDYREPLLVWIKPSLASLSFIKTQLTNIGLSHISSVGCGCGTLEWLIEKATGMMPSDPMKYFIVLLLAGLRVTGYEVNRSWWEGQHSTPHFINIEFVDELIDKSCIIPSDTAVMFCYFNNNEYFHRYLSQYQGITNRVM